MKVYRKPRTKRVFKQGSNPWGLLPYPKTSTVASAGCGLVSITHLALEISKYADATPETFYNFMVKYAVQGHGTEWVGIDKGMEYLGLTDIKRVSNIRDMYKEMAKGDRVAVFLFGNEHAPNGILWTSGGHYIAAVGYKVGKRHYFYTKDSGFRNHDGWYSYERSMKGTIKQMWVGKLPPETITLPERGYFQFGDQGEEVKKIQRFLKKHGYFKGSIGGHYRRLTKRAVERFQSENGLKIDGLFGVECLKAYNKYA